MKQKRILKTREIADGVELLNRRYCRDDAEMQKLVEEEFQKLEKEQQLEADARTKNATE